MSKHDALRRLGGRGHITGQNRGRGCFEQQEPGRLKRQAGPAGPNGRVES